MWYERNVMYYVCIYVIKSTVYVQLQLCAYLLFLLYVFFHFIYLFI